MGLKVWDRNMESVGVNRSFLSVLFVLTVTMHSFAQGKPKDKPLVTPWEAKLANYLKGLPEDVVKHIQRMDNCDHWFGEDGYDAERAKEISSALAKLKCSRLKSDKVKLPKVA
jgi:hypothetical protein